MKSHPELEFDTPLPGMAVSDETAAVVLRAFLATFRTVDPTTVPTNVPTACVLKGRKDPAFLRRAPFTSRKTILVWFESAGQLHEATPQAVLQYLEDRQPWEDYDICLFDASLQWCIGLTHNADVIVVENEHA